ncbi:MAG: recombinase family protein, partial [Terriglobia bacterium]
SMLIQSLPPVGYRVVANEQRGHRTKKTLEIDPIQAETVRLIFRPAREEDAASGPMGVKAIATHLNTAGIRTRAGGRWGVGGVHSVLTRTTYVGRHRFKVRRSKGRERNPDAEIVEMTAPPTIDAADFADVQTLLKSRPLAQRVEVDAKEVRIMRLKSELLRTLVAASSAKAAGFGVPSFVCPS